MAPRARKNREKAKIKTIFEFVRKNFFPMWDKNQEWKISLTKDPFFRGRCDTEKKKIVINALCPALIIHEICHAVAAPHHGKRFQNRMSKAGQTANILGYPKIAENILKDLNTPGFRIIHQQVYDEIHDAIITCPKVTYKQLISYMASQYGMYPWEFLRRFKRCERVFKGGKRFIEEIKKKR